MAWARSLSSSRTGMDLTESQILKPRALLFKRSTFALASMTWSQSDHYIVGPFSSTVVRGCLGCSLARTLGPVAAAKIPA
eukprot:4039241-Amphidinium_carterae.1